jgi:hypothetical protein
MVIGRGDFECMLTDVLLDMFGEIMCIKRRRSVRVLTISCSLRWR